MGILKAGEKVVILQDYIQFGVDWFRQQGKWGCKHAGARNNHLDTGCKQSNGENNYALAA